MKLTARFANRRRDITCGRAVALLTDYLDEALPASRRAELEQHLSGCPHCAEYLAQLKAIIAGAGRVDSDQLSPDMRQALIQLYRQARRRGTGLRAAPKP